MGRERLPATDPFSCVTLPKRRGAQGWEQAGGQPCPPRDPSLRVSPQGMPCATMASLGEGKTLGTCSSSFTSATVLLAASALLCAWGWEKKKAAAQSCLAPDKKGSRSGCSQLPQQHHTALRGLLKWDVWVPDSSAGLCF